MPFPVGGLAGAGDVAGEALRAGAAVAARAGEVAGGSVAVAGAPVAAGLAPIAGDAPAARPVAGAPVGGGMFFGFSVLIFCCNCALAFGSEMPDQPVSSFGCAIFAFTFFGASVGGAFFTVIGAATISLPLSTFMAAPG